MINDYYNFSLLHTLACDSTLSRIRSPWGAERRVLGARAPTKFSEEILQWAGTHKVLAEKVSGYGNFR